MSNAPTAQSLKLFVIMNGDRGYHSVRAGGSAFRDNPEDFTLFRNEKNAERLINREIQKLKGLIMMCKERDLDSQYIAGYNDLLAEWAWAEVHQVVN